MGTPSSLAMSKTIFQGSSIEVLLYPYFFVVQNSNPFTEVVLARKDLVVTPSSLSNLKNFILRWFVRGIVISLFQKSCQTFFQGSLAKESLLSYSLWLKIQISFTEQVLARRNSIIMPSPLAKLKILF